MKNITSILSITLLTAVAQASGFVCESTDGDLRVRAYDQVQPELGTRSAAVMVLSDTTVSHGRKTIAKFTNANQTLSSRSSVYTADVDLRFNDSGRKGEWIAGTKLGELSEIVLDVDFSYSPYSAQMQDGDETTAQLILEKRNGEQLEIDMTCVRYLKN